MSTQNSTQEEGSHKYIYEMFPDIDPIVIEELFKELRTEDEVIERCTKEGTNLNFKDSNGKTKMPPRQPEPKKESRPPQRRPNQSRNKDRQESNQYRKNFGSSESTITPKPVETADLEKQAQKQPSRRRGQQEQSKSQQEQTKATQEPRRSQEQPKTPQEQKPPRSRQESRRAPEQTKTRPEPAPTPIEERPVIKEEKAPEPKKTILRLPKSLQNVNPSKDRFGRFSSWEEPKKPQIELSPPNELHQASSDKAQPTVQTQTQQQATQPPQMPAQPQLIPFYYDPTTGFMMPVMPMMPQQGDQQMQPMMMYPYPPNMQPMQPDPRVVPPKPKQ